MTSLERFPIGGERQPVYDFLRHNGYVEATWDKHWKRADGVELHLYGTGSMARIYDANRNLLADDYLADAVAKVPHP